MTQDSATPGNAGPRPGRARPAVIAGAGIVLGVLATSLYFMWLSPAAREAHRFIREMPADRIIEIRIEPASVDSLTDRAVVVRDRQQIAIIADQLRAATRIAPNHPSARWSAVLRIVTDGHDYGGDIESTSNQGFLVWYASGVRGGWNYGTYRQDSLGPILEAMIRSSTVAAPFK